MKSSLIHAGCGDPCERRCSFARRDGRRRTGTKLTVVGLRLHPQTHVDEHKGTRTDAPRQRRSRAAPKQRTRPYGAVQLSSECTGSISRRFRGAGRPKRARGSNTASARATRGGLGKPTQPGSVPRGRATNLQKTHEKDTSNKEKTRSNPSRQRGPNARLTSELINLH